MSDLDELLRDWSTQRELDPLALDRLSGRICEQVVNEVLATPKTEASPSERRQPWGMSLVALIVASVLVVTGWLMMDRGRQEHWGDLADAASMPESSSVLINELDRLFDGQWRWMGEFNGELHLEAAQTEDDIERSAPRIAVRFVTIERRRNESQWRVIWNAAVVTRSEEYVRLPARLTGHDAVSVWAYALPDGAVFVESQLALRGATDLDVSTEKMFPQSKRRGSRVVELWSGRQPDREVRVLEAIEVVPAVPVEQRV